MTTKTEKSPLQIGQDRIWDALGKLQRHFSIPMMDRYAGEFADEGKCRVHFGLGNEKTRDDFVDALNERVKALGDTTGLEGIEIEAANETKRSDNPWPYQMKIEAHASTTLKAYLKLAAFLENVASVYPAPDRGTPWADYVAKYAVGDQMIWKNGAEYQIKQFDAITLLRNNIEMHVVGAHTSKSISLPVVQVELPTNGTLVTIRDNFHDICVSVDAKFPVKNDRDFASLFNTKAADGYYEGFPKSLVHGAYEKDRQHFSACLGNYSDLMILLGDLVRQDATTNLRTGPVPRPGGSRFKQS